MTLKNKNDISINKTSTIKETKESLKKQSKNVALSLLKRRPYKVSKGQLTKGKVSFQFEGEGYSFKVFKSKDELVFMNAKTGVYYHYWVNGEKLLQNKMERLILSQR